MNFAVHPLTPERWADLEALFLARGCAMARSCWCMYYRESSRIAVPARLTAAEYRRQRLQALAADDPPPGLIGYRDGVPVGWVSLGPREAFPRLRRSPVAKAVDDLPVWSIVCFVVPPAYRNQGVATGLLQGAIAFARERGAVALEAYPVDKPVRSADASMWFGAMSMYAKAGFVEVARRRPERPVVRLGLGSA
ncbi:MAG: Acetyltransferase, GNAT family [Candidatus Bipolaricaulis sibiricus]|uniref:Acetyltransferase, GNAT family n=1 Tax=Bipolaricaulis sibiricus TaxID=2501609 RepID=A0A410FSW2_BIPS1|nr:MAG: Acetyltransferase, GNAT family [Candidatus Bipolaricaulis sibiricus]